MGALEVNFFKYIIIIIFTDIIATHTDYHFEKFETMCILHYEVMILFTHTIQSNIASRRPQEDRENLIIHTIQSNIAPRRPQEDRENLIIHTIQSNIAPRRPQEDRENHTIQSNIAPRRQKILEEHRFSGRRNSVTTTPLNFKLHPK